MAEKELGFHASQDLETMCKDLWNWQTKNPEGYVSSTASATPVTVPTPAAPTPAPVPTKYMQPDAQKPVIAEPQENGVKPDQTKSLAKDETQPLPGGLLVAAPTIPSEREMFDPSTPAHLSPAHSDDGHHSGGKFPIKALSTLSLRD